MEPAQSEACDMVERAGADQLGEVAVDVSEPDMSLSFDGAGHVRQTGSNHAGHPIVSLPYRNLVMAAAD